jgi:tetratricopeptide (TPR) repeat protein
MREATAARDRSLAEHDLIAGERDSLRAELARAQEEMREATAARDRSLAEHDLIAGERDSLRAELARAQEEMREAVVAERAKAAQNLSWFEAAIPNDGERLRSQRQYPLQTFFYGSRMWTSLAVGLKRRRRILIEAAKQARDRRNWALAARYYRDALDLAADRPGLWVQFGHALKEAGTIEWAEKAYRISLGLDAQIPDTHLHLGHVLKLQGRNAEAIEAYMRCLSLAPGSADAMNELRAFGSRGKPVAP